MRRLKGIAHSLWGHKWSKWKTFKTARDSDFGVPLAYQSKTCEICGKYKTRREMS